MIARPADSVRFAHSISAHQVLEDEPREGYFQSPAATNAAQ